MITVYNVHKVKLYHISKLCGVGKILYRCGKHMAKEQALHHWDNSWLKTWVVVMLCALKNEIYLVKNQEGTAVATFQTKTIGDSLHFGKLATDPDQAGKGVGSFCMATIERLARQRGCKCVRCEVYDKSEHAIAFYTQKNYRVTGECNSIKYRQLKMEKTVGEKV